MILGVWKRVSCNGAAADGSMQGCVSASIGWGTAEVFRTVVTPGTSMREMLLTRSCRCGSGRYLGLRTLVCKSHCALLFCEPAALSCSSCPSVDHPTLYEQFECCQGHLLPESAYETNQRHHSILHVKSFLTSPCERTTARYTIQDGNAQSLAMLMVQQPAACRTGPCCT